jgi:DNA-binding transcriptional MerR regulator
MDKNTNLFNESINNEEKKNLNSENSENADMCIDINFIKILPIGEFKYSIMENFMKSYCKVEIDKRALFYYIEKGLIPHGVNKVKNTSYYTSEHILLYYLINVLKEHKSLKEIADFFNILFTLPHFGSTFLFRVEILKKIISNYLRLKITIGKSYKENFLNFMSEKLLESFEYDIANNIQNDEKNLLHEYSSYIAFVLMGNSMSESFKDLGLTQLQSFMVNNLENIQNLKINEGDLLNYIEVTPEKVIFKELELKLNNSVDEVRKLEEEIKKIYDQLIYHNKRYGELNEELEDKEKVYKEAKKKRFIEKIKTK